MTPLPADILDAEASLVRTLLRTWTPDDRKLLVPPSADLRDALRYRLEDVPDLLKPDEAVLSRALDHAGLVLHLAARNPAGSAYDLGSACWRAQFSDVRFTRLLRTPAYLRLEMLSRLTHKLSRSQIPIRWIASWKDGDSTASNAHRTSTDEVWPVLNFLFGEHPESTIMRWAAGYYRTSHVVEEARNHLQQ